MSADLTRTELRRIADEFQSERDAAKRDAMRAFDERNILLAQIAELEKELQLERKWRYAAAAELLLFRNARALAGR